MMKTFTTFGDNFDDLYLKKLQSSSENPHAYLSMLSLYQEMIYGNTDVSETISNSSSI